MEQPDNERKTIIFTSTKRTADEITRFLRQDGFPALAIHGDKQQNERDWVLNQFRSGGHPIMVATDVASRGIGTCIFYYRKRDKCNTENISEKVFIRKRTTFFCVFNMFFYCYRTRQLVLIHCNRLFRRKKVFFLSFLLVS